jgi:hypothetical protein
MSVAFAIGTWISRYRLHGAGRHGLLSFDRGLYLITGESQEEGFKWIYIMVGVKCSESYYGVERT